VCLLSYLLHIMYMCIVLPLLRIASHCHYQVETVLLPRLTMII